MRLEWSETWRCNPQIMPLIQAQQEIWNFKTPIQCLEIYLALPKMQVRMLIALHPWSILNRQFQSLTNNTSSGNPPLTSWNQTSTSLPCTQAILTWVIFTTQGQLQLQELFHHSWLSQILKSQWAGCPSLQTFLLPPPILSPYIFGQKIL